MKLRLPVLILTTVLLLTACAAGTEPTEPLTPEPPEPPSIEAPAPEAGEDITEEPPMKHQTVVYFANWNLDRENGAGEAASVPWDSVTYVNHAFWAVEPSGEETETSFERRASGKGPRTDFRIASMAPEADYGDVGESVLLPGTPRNHFAEYAALSERYPEVNILISIGGWTRCGYFSEMAYTAEGRASFIGSCLDLMREYPFIDGIDIDWEYPAGSRDGERQPDGTEGDQGCPIFGTPAEDRENFALLLAELRAAMAEEFGEGAKKLTACASGSVGWTLPCQDWAAAAPHLDLINIMTYDLAGLWDGITGHASGAQAAKGGAMYFKMKDIPLDKLCVGSPLYGSPFQMTEKRPIVVGTPVTGPKPTGDFSSQRILELEAEAVSGYTIIEEDGAYLIGERFDNGGAGWHFDYDERNGAAYIWNDDAESEDYLLYISYENRLSLQEKLRYIKEKGLGGIIVWENSQDADDHRFIRQMHEQLEG